MDIEKLIKDVTELVYEKIREYNYEGRGRKIFLLPGTKEIKIKYSLFISDWDDIAFIDEEIDTIDEYDHIICPEMTNNDLIDISIGRAGSQISSLLIEGLFKGKRITCVDEGLEYTKYENRANGPFYKMFEGYKEVLMDYGVEFVGFKDLGKVLGLDEKGERTKIISTEHKIITEACVEKLWNEGFNRIKLPKGSIVTPLTEDFIRKNNIKVIHY